MKELIDRYEQQENATSDSLDRYIEIKEEKLLSLLKLKHEKPLKIF